MPRVCGSCEAISEQELQRTVEADVGQGRRARASRLARRRAEAQKAVIAFVGGGQTFEAVEQRSRIVWKVSRKRRDLRLAIEAVTAERLASERPTGDRR